MAVSKLRQAKVKVVGSDHAAAAWRPFARSLHLFAAVCRRQPFATAIVTVFLIAGIFAPLLAPYNPATIQMAERLQGPSAAHLLGTDEFGRDLLSRILYGARIAFLAGIVAVGIAMVGGVLIGLVSGYFGTAVDYILSRIVEALQAFPAVLLAIAITAILGPSIRNAMIAIGIATIPDFARMTRGVVLPTKEMPFVEAARVTGCSDGRILRTAILPACVPAIAVILSFDMANAILWESALSYLGLGAQPPEPSWGTMLASAKSYTFSDPIYALLVGLVLSLTIVGLNMFGDAVREVSDPFRH